MNFVRFNQFLLYLSSTLPVISLIIGLNKISAIKKELLPILILVGLSTLIRISNLFFGDSNILSPGIYFVYSLIEFALLCLFYSFIIDKRITWLFFFLVGTFIILCWLDYAIIGPNNINTFSTSSESILIILYSLLLLTFIMKKMMYENLLHIPFFWINSGILIYYTGNLFLLALDKYIVNYEKGETIILASIHSFFYLVYNIFLIIGFLKIKKT
jgi:hypothetical protein